MRCSVASSRFERQNFPIARNQAGNFQHKAFQGAEYTPPRFSQTAVSVTQTTARATGLHRESRQRLAYGGPTSSSFSGRPLSPPLGRCRSHNLHWSSAHGKVDTATVYRPKQSPSSPNFFCKKSRSLSKAGTQLKCTACPFLLKHPLSV